MAPVTRTTLLVLIAFQYFDASDASALCTKYMGGMSTVLGFEVHYFACCDNSQDADSSCTGMTWQGGSSESYCGSRGDNTWPGADVKYRFICSGCSAQSYAASTCARWDYPGICWKWLNCFENNCNSNRKRQSQSDFCGNSVCDSGESPDNCPLDCCGTVNAMCADSGCTPECCSTATCCNDGNVGNGDTVLHHSQFLYTLALLGIFVV